MQNQDLRQSKLQRHFSDPNFNINNDSQVNNYPNIIHQEPYKNNNESFYKNNNTLRINDPINPLSQSNISKRLNGKVIPRLETLQKIAEATHTRLIISFENIEGEG